MTDNEANSKPNAPGGPAGSDEAANPGGDANPPPPPKSGGGGTGVLALLLALGAAGGTGYLWYTLDAERKAQTAQVTQLEESLRRAQEQSAQLDSRLEQAHSQSGQLDSRLEQVQAQSAELDSRMAEAMAQAGESDSRLEQAITQAGSLEEAIAQAMAESERLSQAAADALAELGGRLEESLGSLDSRLEAGLGQAGSSLEEALASLNTQLDEAVGTLDARLEQALTQADEGLQASAQAAREGLQASADAAREQFESVQSQIQEILADLGGAGERLSAYAQEQAQVLDGLSQRLEELGKGQQSLSRALAETRTTADLSEVSYLLRMASHKASLEHDMSAARRALVTARDRLAALGLADFAQVQRMIEEDIATVEGVKLPDIGSLTQRLGALQEQIDDLPLRVVGEVEKLKAAVKPNVGEGAPDASPEDPWWERASAAAWYQLKDIVVIRHERGTQPPLVAIEEEYFLRQNLRLELETMRLAAVRGDGTSYQDANKTARQWAQTYMDAGDAAVQSFVAALEGLQAVELTPYVPDLSGTVKAFQEAMAGHETGSGERLARAGEAQR